MFLSCVQISILVLKHYNIILVKVEDSEQMNYSVRNKAHGWVVVKTSLIAYH